jgi:signal transduction histidine kinase
MGIAAGGHSGDSGDRSRTGENPYVGGEPRMVAAVVEQLWRAVGVYRVVSLVYAAVLIVYDHGGYARPLMGFLVLAVMVVWTVLAPVLYARPTPRRPLVAADVAVAAALIIATRWVQTAGHIEHGAATLPVCWAAAPVLACAVAGGPWTGVAGAAVISAADVAERQGIAPNTFNGIVLLLVAGAVGGHVVRLAVQAEAAVDRAARVEAAAAERQRIARDIHDSVLQVLALIGVRGRELGGAAADLGRLAAEQEAALRSLVTAAPPSGAGEVDLRPLLEGHVSERVTVSCPAEPVLLPAATARAFAAAVGESLDNVRRHAGTDARAWVLLEDEETVVTLAVRDDGVGFAADRLAEAARAGRLGVAQSIICRIRELGGEAEVTAVPGQGTEVELRVHRR